MKIKQVLEALEQFAPLPLQESWDNAGLQIGLTEAEVSGALLCVDVTERIIDEAVQRGCNLVVSHHPLLFRGLKQVAGQNYVQRTVMKAIKSDVAVISMHTNLDSAPGGVNFKIAERLGLNSVHFGDSAPALAGSAPGSDTPPTGTAPAPAVSGLGGSPAEKGQWVMGELKEPMVSCDFVLHVKRQL